MDVRRPWDDLAASQAGLVCRRQLNELGVDRWLVRNQVSAGRWILRSSMVVSTTTGPLSREQTQWLGVLHAGPRAALCGLSATEVHGLKRWHRDDIYVMIPADLDVDDPPPGIVLQRTRRPLSAMLSARELPTLAVEPAALLWAGYERSTRSAEGLLAAVVQQGLTTPEALQSWVPRLQPLRRARHLRRVLAEIDGGAQSVSELDVRRLCDEHRLARPARQTPRLDASGRHRFTDCEWLLPDGRRLVLEVDGSFHMDVEGWEDDLVHQRDLTATDLVLVRCTSRELREDRPRLAADLVRLGVPRRDGVVRSRVRPAAP